MIAARVDVRCDFTFSERIELVVIHSDDAMSKMSFHVK